MQTGGKDVKVLTCDSCVKSPKKSTQKEARDASMPLNFLLQTFIESLWFLWCLHSSYDVDCWKLNNTICVPNAFCYISLVSSAQLRRSGFVYTEPDSSYAGRKTLSDRAFVQTYTNGFPGPVSVMERSCAPPILNVCWHLSDWCLCHSSLQCEQMFPCRQSVHCKTLSRSVFLV